MGILTFKGGVHPYDGKELSKNSPVVKYLPKGDMENMEFPLRLQENPQKGHAFLRQWNLTVIFSRSAVRGLFLFTIHWKLFSTIFMYDHRGFFRRILEFQSDRKAYMSDIASAVREN